MGTSYWRAKDVEEIAEKLIAEHHTHLADQRIHYLFREPTASSKGNVVLGKARKIGGINAHLVGLVGRDHLEGPADFFVVEIAAVEWQELTEAQRIALVDHELCHFDVEEPEDPDKDRKLIVRGHDLEEFQVIVERHGLWRPPVEEFVTAARQTTIDDQLTEGDEDA